jgi:hypothetical protein
VVKRSDEQPPDEQPDERPDRSVEPVAGRSDGLVWWHELAYVGILYSIIRNLFGSASVGATHAFHNAQRIIRYERWLGIFHEATVQRWFLDWPWFIQLWNDFYGTFHFAVTLGVLVATFRVWPHAYRFWRNTLAFTTGLALIGFGFYPLMPPRLLCDCAGGAGPGVDYGFVDTLAHLAWAVWCALVLVPRLRRPWSKALVVAYPVATMFAITVTANHYFLDAAAGLITLGAGYLLARLVAKITVHDAPDRVVNGRGDRVRLLQ